MSPKFEVVCDSPCNGCLFYSVCWLTDTDTPFPRAEICVDYNFCSKNFVYGFSELDIYFPDV